MNLDNWIKSITKKAPIYEHAGVPVLNKLKDEFTEHEERIRQIQAIQDRGKPCSVVPVTDARVQLAWELCCDPFELTERECALQDELVRLTDELRKQSELNLEMKRSISSLHDMTARYTHDTEQPADIENIGDAIVTLKRKQEEYLGMISKNQQSKDDVGHIFEIIQLQNELTVLDRQLAQFHGLPPTIPEALTAIACAEAELVGLEEAISMRLQ